MLHPATPARPSTAAAVFGATNSGKSDPLPPLTLSPTWLARAACRDSDPAIFDVEGGPAGEAIRICRTCPVRRECLADDLTSGNIPGGIRAGIGEGDREAFARAYAIYRNAVGDYHGEIIALAGRREAHDGLDAGAALRDLADRVAEAADTMTGLVLATAAGLPASALLGDDEQTTSERARARALVKMHQADLVRAHQAHMTAIARLSAAEKPAGQFGETPEAMWARMRLLTLAGQVARAAAAVPTAIPAPVPAPAGSTLAGAA